MQCSYAASACEPVEWVLVAVCDKCDEKIHLELCETHYNPYREYALGHGWHASYIACNQCFGSISFAAQQISTGAREEHVNP
jgi:hypothetical protein